MGEAAISEPPAGSSARAARLPARARGALRRRRHAALRMRRPDRLPPVADGRRAAGDRRRRCSASSRPALHCGCRSCRAAPAPGSPAARCRPATACCSRWRSSCASCASIRARASRVVQPGVRNAVDLGGRGAATASTTRPIRRARSRAPSAATSPRTPAACIASSTGSRCTTCCACAASPSKASRSSSAAKRSTRRATTCSRSRIGSEGMLVVVTEVTVKLLPKPQSARVHHGLVRRRRESAATRSPTSSPPASSRRASR